MLIPSGLCLENRAVRPNRVVKSRGNSGGANHNSSLPVPEPVCVCLCVPACAQRGGKFARRQVRGTGRRQTGRSSLDIRAASLKLPLRHVFGTTLCCFDSEEMTSTDRVGRQGYKRAHGGRPKDIFSTWRALSEMSPEFQQEGTGSFCPLWCLFAHRFRPRSSQICPVLKGQLLSQYCLHLAQDESKLRYG